MDWLEEKWEGIKARLHNASLAKSLWGYALLTLITVFVCAKFTKNISYSWIQALQSVNDSGVYLANPDFLRAEGEIGWQLKLLVFIFNYCNYIFLVLGFFVMSKIFLEKKIKIGAKEAANLLQAMAIGDLSYEIQFCSEDEMGQICRECKVLQKALVREKENQWENQEEQRKINSAFAHDIRTPLTVIKGYTEFLIKYVPKGRVTQETLLERLDTMLYQEKRLLEFSETMSTIQEAEQRALSLSWHSLRRVRNQIEVLVGCMEDMVKIRVEVQGDLNQEIFLDLDALMESLENILNNSLRFARNQITLLLQLKGQWLYIYLADDGPGFSDRALREADKFYYSEAKGEEHHFGMGLSIGKMLCEKHGGSLKLTNGVDGGAIVAMEIGVGRKIL